MQDPVEFTFFFHLQNCWVSKIFPNLTTGSLCCVSQGTFQCSGLLSWPVSKLSAPAVRLGLRGLLLWPRRELGGFPVPECIGLWCNDLRNKVIKHRPIAHSKDPSDCFHPSAGTHQSSLSFSSNMFWLNIFLSVEGSQSNLTEAPVLLDILRHLGG